MSEDNIMQLLQRAYLAGFDCTREGYNAEYPFYDKERRPTDDAKWVARRDQILAQLAGGHNA